MNFCSLPGFAAPLAHQPMTGRTLRFAGHVQGAWSDLGASSQHEGEAEGQECGRWREVVKTGIGCKQNLMLKVAINNAIQKGLVFETNYSWTSFIRSLVLPSNTAVDISFENLWRYSNGERKNVFHWKKIFLGQGCFSSPFGKLNFIPFFALFVLFSVCSFLLYLFRQTDGLQKTL